MLNFWTRLNRYLDTGRVERDNNLIDNTVRPPANGRKKYLFAGSHKADEPAAVVYWLPGTCKLHGINPHAWLTDVLERIRPKASMRCCRIIG